MEPYGRIGESEGRRLGASKARSLMAKARDWVSIGAAAWIAFSAFAQSTHGSAWAIVWMLCSIACVDSAAAWAMRAVETEEASEARLPDGARGTS